jgi:hypothetical protein
VNNQSGGVWDIKNDSDIRTYNGGGTAVFNNTGTFLKSGGGITTVNVPFHNLPGGVIQVQSGTLTLAGTSSSVGSTFQLSGSGILDLPNHTFQGTHSASGSGTVLLKNATIGSGGATFAFSGNTLQWADGTINTGSEALTNTGTFNISDYNYRYFSGTLNNSGTLNYAPTGGYVLLLNNATNTTVNNQSGGVWDIKNDSDIRTYNGGGTAVLNNAGTFRKSGGTGTSTVDSKFNNTGTVEVRSGTLVISNTPQLTGTSTTLIGGTWNIYGDTANATLTINSGSNIKINQGNVTLSGTESTFAKINTMEKNEGSFAILNGRNFTTGGAFTNAGNMTIDTGSTFKGGSAGTSSYTQTAGVTTVNGKMAAIVGMEGGIIKGTGTIDGNLTVNGGKIQPGNSPGTITITGNYIQSGGGTLDIEILNNGVYDQLYVNKTVTLAGTLNVSLLSGANITNGQTFTILHAINGLSSDLSTPSHFTEFTSYTGLFDKSKPLWFEASYSTNNITLTAHGSSAVPLPPSLLLLGTGLIGIGAFARRRKGENVIFSGEF